MFDDFFFSNGGIIQDGVFQSFYAFLHASIKVIYFSFLK
jgi:hypothetical protein